MPSLFISHTDRDNAEVMRLSDWLARQGVASLFLDFDPERGVPAGAKWEAELYSQLRRADAVLFVGSPASVASQWCFAELAMARSLGKAILPVTVAPGGEHPLLRDTQAVDVTGGDERGFERLASWLRGADLDPERSFAWDSRRRPFPGLGSFEELDAAVFFGREPEVEELLERVRSSRRRHTGRLLVVVGPSGSGKSSLVQAGLIPRLRRAHQPWLVLPTLRPSGGPVRQLALVLADGFRAAGAPRSVEQLEQALTAGADALVELAEELSHVSPVDDKPAVLVFVDQAEELVTPSDTHESDRFLSLLYGATRTEGPLWSILTLRSEFLSAFLQSAGGPQLLGDQLAVGPLDRSRLPEVIERPAARTGLDFAPGLVGRMVEDTGGGDGLPLLAHTLAELYQRAKQRGSHVITARDYEDLGGVVGGLRRSADGEQRRLADRGLGELVVPTLTKLVALGPEGQPTRRRLPRRALSEQERQVVDAFIEARLVISSQADGEAVVEVAHEALLRQWPPLSQAIERDRDDLVLRSEVERAAQDWDRVARRDDYLLTGERLRATRHLTAWQHPDATGELSDVTRHFLAASHHRHEREQAARRRRIQRAFAALITALVVMSALSVVALIQANRATHQRDVTQATLLATNALGALAANPGESLALGMEAYAKQRTDLTDAALRLAASEATPQVISDFDEGHNGLAFAPDGRHLASAGSDGTVRVWDWRDPGTHDTVLRGHRGPVHGVAFAPDGRHLASAGSDGTVRVWDWRAPRAAPTVLRGHRGAVLSVAFANDGRHLSSAGIDGTVRVWDWRARGTPAIVLRGHRGPVHGVAFAPDGRHVASAGSDGTVRVWDWRDPRAPATVLRGHRGPVHGVAFAPDGRHLASAGNDTTVRVWDWRDPQTPAIVLGGHTGAVNCVAFAPDGRQLASAANDATVRVWDWRDPQNPATVLRGHTDWVTAVAFPRDGRHLASASTNDDDSVRVWDWRAPRTAATVLRGHHGPARGVAFAPDARHLASAGSDGTVRVWDWRDPQTPATVLRGHRGPVNAVAFAPDGRHLASAGSDGTVRVWDWRDPQTPATVLRGHRGPVNAVAFAPDGRHLASTGSDGTVRVWDSRNPRTAAAVLPPVSPTGLGVAFAPDGHHVASASGGTGPIVWDLRAPDKASVTVGTSPAVALGSAFASDGRRVATADLSGGIDVWDLRASADADPTVLGADQTSLGAAFSRDGRDLASGGRDGTVRVWDWRAPQTPATVLRGQQGSVNGVAFAPDGRHLASAGNDATVRVWDCQRCGGIRHVLELAHERSPLGEEGPP